MRRETSSFHVSSSAGTDEMITGSKIEPMKSNEKYGEAQHVAEGVVGTDDNIDHARIEPMGGTGTWRIEV